MIWRRWPKRRPPAKTSHLIRSSPLPYQPSSLRGNNSKISAAARPAPTWPRSIVSSPSSPMPRHCPGNEMDRYEKAAQNRAKAALLNKSWGVGAVQARYRETGNWYHTLKRFPAALFDAHGYFVFPTEDALRASP